ncbi:MAG: hypothetical protein ACK5O2_01180 [Microthrixaceae bacterium]
MSSHGDRVTPEDIRSKLTEIQGEATEEVESAKNQLVAVGVLAGLALLIVAYLLGRRGGKRASAVIEVHRG